MKKKFFIYLVISVVSSASFANQADDRPGCLDCFNFVAPSILGAENVNPAEIGLIVYDSYYNSFRGYTSLGTWSKLSDEKNIKNLSSSASLTSVEDFVTVNATSGNVLLTLPAVSTVPGKQYDIKKTDSSTNVVTIDGNSTELIDGAPAKYLSGQYESIKIVSNGSSWLVVGKVPRTPTVTVKTSGSGTYTTPAGVTYLKIKMVGGGAGGSGGGNSPGSGGSGAATTFGSSLLTANGGASASGDISHAGPGGSYTINSPAYGSGWTGGAGGSAGRTTFEAGGSGGSSCFGGAGISGMGSSIGSYYNGTAGAPNSGGGGGGGGSDGGAQAGAGGSSGGCIEAYISVPVSTYSYSVGAGGTSGSAGTYGGSGGAGGSGYIEITEYYQ